MATLVITKVLDDIDGSEDAATVSFALEGKKYEIDLSDDNKKKLQDALAPFIKVARSGATRANGGSTKAGRKDLAEIREWANANGHNVSPKGRIPQAIVEEYDAAQ